MKYLCGIVRIGFLDNVSESVVGNSSLITVFIRGDDGTTHDVVCGLGVSNFGAKICS